MKWKLVVKELESKFWNKKVFHLEFLFYLIAFVFNLQIFSQESELPNATNKRYNLQSKGIRLENLEGNSGKRYAIIIGINDYKDTGISHLTKARNDAKVVGKIFNEQGQFDLTFVMTDDVDIRQDSEHSYPNKLNIEEKIESVLRMATPQDLIVLFFSGHGLSDANENGYLVTVDTVADKKFETSIKVDWIISQFKKKEMTKTLLILDACRDVLYSTKNITRDSIVERDFNEGEVAATFYSTKSGFFSYEDDESEYGVFTKYLVYGMEGRGDSNSDGVVSFSELEQFVQNEVKTWSIRKNKMQKPYTKIYGEKTGDLAITFSKEDKRNSIIDKPIQQNGISRSDILWRSAVIPGWGQLYNGNKLKGSIFFFGMIGLIYNYQSKYNKYNSLKSDYESATNRDTLLISSAYSQNPISTAPFAIYVMEDKQLNHAKIASNQLNQVANFLIVFYLINLIDSAFSEIAVSKIGYIPTIQNGFHFSYRKEPFSIRALEERNFSDRNYSLGYSWNF